MLIVKSGNTFLVDPESTLDKMSIRTNYWMTLSADCSLFNSNCFENSSVDKSCGDAPSPEDIEKLQDIPNPDAVKKIGFLGHLGISGYTPLECILSPCKNITSLYLHMSLFCPTKKEAERREPWQASFCLPNIKELVIDSSGVSHEDSKTLFSFKQAFIQIAKFLTAQKFEKLEKLIVGLPYMESTEGLFTRALCIFLGEHAKSLKIFAYNQKYEVPDDEETPEDDDDDGKEGTGSKSGIEFSTNVNYLSLSQLATSMKELKHVVLEELYVNLVKRQESAPVWKNLLIAQNTMKKCIFVGDKIPLPGGTVEVNAATLVTLRLDVRDSVDLRYFEKCYNLKSLSLGGRHDANESGHDLDLGDDQYSSFGAVYEPPVQLKNAKYLPSCLESLEIINLRTDKDEARVLCLELPGLKELIMVNLGWEGSLGLKLTHLVGIFEKRQLDHFRIKSSVNMLSYQEMEDECQLPVGNLFACVIQSNSFAAATKFTLEVWKTPEGKYTTRNDNDDEDELDVFEVPDKVAFLEEEEEEEDSSRATTEQGEEEDENSEEATDNEEDPTVLCSETDPEEYSDAVDI